MEELTLDAEVQGKAEDRHGVDVEGDQKTEHVGIGHRAPRGVRPRERGYQTHPGSTWWPRPRQFRLRVPLRSHHGHFSFLGVFFRHLWFHGPNTNPQRVPSRACGLTVVQSLRGPVLLTSTSSLF